MGPDVLAAAADFHVRSAAQAQRQIQRALLLDVVVGEGAAVLQLLAGEDQALLVGEDALLVLDHCLDGVDGVVRLYIESDGRADQGLEKNLKVSLF